MPSMQGTPGSIPAWWHTPVFPVLGRYKVISGYPVNSMPAWDIEDSSPDGEKTRTVTHCTMETSLWLAETEKGPMCGSSAILTCQPRSRKLTYSSCFLQACLWSLLLFSAWTKTKNQGRREKHIRIQIPLSLQWGSSHWTQGLKDSSGSEASLRPSWSPLPFSRGPPPPVPLRLSCFQTLPE